MAADALASYIARTPTAMVLIVQDKLRLILRLCEEGFLHVEKW